MIRVMSLAALAGLALGAAPAEASFLARLFGDDGPVIYRPVVTPETFYFQPGEPRHVHGHHVHRHLHGQRVVIRRCADQPRRCR